MTTTNSVRTSNNQTITSISCDHTVRNICEVDNFKIKRVNDNKTGLIQVEGDELPCYV